MTFLFSDPIAQVIIKDWESNNEWVLGPGGIPFLTSVSMSFGGNMTIEKFMVGVDIPYDYALQKMDPKETPFKQKNYVKARIGYANGGWIDWEYGHLLNGAKGLSMTPEGLSGTLEVVPIPIKAVGYTVSKGVFDKSEYNAAKLIELLVSDLGMEVEITERARGNLGVISREFYGGLTSRSVWDSIKEICRNSYCKFVIRSKNSVKYLTVCTIEDQVKGELADNSDNPNKYVIRGGIDPGNNQYPCYSFTPQGDETGWVAGTASAAASGTEATAIDKETGEDVTITTKPEDSEEAIVGSLEHDVPKDIKGKDSGFERYVVDNLKGDNRAATFISAPLLPNGTEVFKRQIKEFNQHGDSGIRMEIATIGHPNEKVGNICHLHMAGLLYDGPYYIDKMTHSWGLGNWDMTLSVHRRGSKAQADEKKETRGGQMK